jgi:hypothetical protein
MWLAECRNRLPCRCRKAREHTLSDAQAPSSGERHGGGAAGAGFDPGGRETFSELYTVRCSCTSSAENHALRITAVLSRLFSTSGQCQSGISIGALSALFSHNSRVSI